MGVTYLTTLVNQNKRLQSYFDSNDKTPLWDGEIHVLSGTSEKKSEIIGKVPVQIKTTLQKKSALKSFPVSISDLKQYLKTGGIVFFVVWLDEDYHLRDIFYKSLPPLSIKKLLKNKKFKSGTQKNFSLSIHSLDSEKIYPILIDFISNSKRQQSFVDKKLIDSGNLPENGKMKFYYYGKGPNGIFDYQNEHDVFAYFEDSDTGIEIPIDNTIEITAMAMKTNLIFRIGESYVYDDVVREFYSDGIVELKIGDAFRISVNDDLGKFTLHYSRPNMLSGAIKSTLSLLELSRVKSVYLNETKIDFSKETLEGLDSLKLNEHLDELQQISEFVQSLKIPIDIDLSKFDEQSQRNLKLLHQGLVLKEKVSPGFEESKLLHLKIANVHFITLFYLDSEQSGILIDIFEETPWCRAGDVDDYEDVSIFEVLNVNDWLKIDNCNFESVISSYQRLVDNRLSPNGANRTLLKILSAADEAATDEVKDKLLCWAQELSDWNLKYCGEESFAIINDLQIKIRKRDLFPNEIGILNHILFNNSQNVEICFGVSVLLKSKHQSDYFWDRMSLEEQESYVEYPIYHLYKML